MQAPLAKNLQAISDIGLRSGEGDRDFAIVLASSWVNEQSFLLHFPYWKLKHKFREIASALSKLRLLGCSGAGAALPGCGVGDPLAISFSRAANAFAVPRGFALLGPAAMAI